MQLLEVSDAVRHIYIYVIMRLRVNKNYTAMHGQRNIYKNSLYKFKYAYGVTKFEEFAHSTNSTLDGYRHNSR